MKKYCIIFDTNVLFRNYDRYADFTCFSFSDTLNHVIEEIEKRDIYDLFTILIPTVVWREMRQNSIEKYNEKLSQLKDKHQKIRLPFHSFEGQDKDFEKFLDAQIKVYKKDLNSKLVKILDLPSPTNSCFYKLVNRAYEKRPPFEGRDKRSDKGFKDALLWEGILQYKRAHPEANIILYTNDNMFNDELKQEYSSIFDNEEILFVNDEKESELMNKLSEMALEKDATFPVPNTDEYVTLKQYLYSDKLGEDIKNFSDKIVGKNEFLRIIDTEFISLTDPIEEVETDEVFTEYAVYAKCKFVIEANKEVYFETTKDLILFVTTPDNKTFWLEDLELNSDEECENDTISTEGY